MGYIKNLYELIDDLQTPLVDTNDYAPEPQYNEVYAQKLVHNGKEYKAFALRPLGFYEVQFGHLPQDEDYQVVEKLLRCGVMAVFNKKSQKLFIHNCTQNVIYITEKSRIISK